jgi:CNT family concentrative nucleoside transporter
MKYFLLLLAGACLFGTQAVGQTLEGEWVFESITDQEGTALFDIDTTKDFLSLSESTFNYALEAKNLLAKGKYYVSDNSISFEYTQPNDTLRVYTINQFNSSRLVLEENGVAYAFNRKSLVEKAAIVSSKGFSINGLLRGALGMIALLFISFIASSNRRAINWKIVGLGLALQCIIAIGVLKVSIVQSAFEGVGKVFIAILEFTQAGSAFLFDGLINNTDNFGYIFAFQVLPTIIFFSAFTSVLFYLGIIQKVVKGLAWLLSKALKISGAESLSVAGNIFLGQTEAPLLIKAYLERMNKSEMLLVMIGGMATVAGAVLAAYIGFLGGDDPVLRLQFAKHLLAASVMAAPGAVVISKILYPQTEPINNDVTVSYERIGSNFLDAIANGTTEGLKLAVNVGAMLLVFVAFIAMFNGILDVIGDWTNINAWVAANSSYSGLTLEAILGTIFAPLMWLIGVASEDTMLMGQLLGIKLAASEFVGYIQLADLKDITTGTHFTYEKSIIMATYMLCGFANFASIGIQIGGIGALAPGQRTVLSKFGMKALIGGTIASLMSATIAGIIIG